MSLKINLDNTWVTSDHHFWHRGILRYRREDQALDDAALAESHDQVIRTWNQTISEDGLVLVLGDFSMAGLNRTEEVLHRLNGSLAFVRGNHDNAKTLRRLKDRNPEKVHSVQDYLEVKSDGMDTFWGVCSHYPMLDWNGRIYGSVMLHGHWHSAHHSYPEGIGRIVNVNWDVAKEPLLLRSVAYSMGAIRGEGGE